jgi:hypothetical protein
LTRLPRRGSPGLRGSGPGVHPRHHRVFSWLVVWPLVHGERANRRARARHGPAPLASQPSRRLLGATSWCTTTWRWWVADQALQALPPPEAGLLALVGASTLTGQRGRRHPVAQQTRLSRPPPSAFGFRLARRMVPWDVSRLPGDVARVRRTAEPASPPETARVRPTLPACRRPAWGQEAVVTAAAADAARATVALSQARGDSAVGALPRTGKCAPGQARHAWVTPRPGGQSSPIRLPPGKRPRRRTVGGEAKRARWRHRGAGPGVRRTWRRNEGPHQPKRLGTHRPELVTARARVGVELRRWWLDGLVKEVPGVVGVGPPQVTNQVGRGERSRAVALRA